MRRPPHGLIASVQASADEPLNRPEHLVAMALSCLNGGSVGLRLSDPAVIRWIRDTRPDTFIIGLTKPDVMPLEPHRHVYITPTMQDVALLAEAGAEMVAVDATQRDRPQPLAEIIAFTRQHCPWVGLMADVATLSDGLAAESLGFDVLSTTLSGYTTATFHRAASVQPDFQLLDDLRRQTRLPVILEGRVWTPEQVETAWQLGAHAVVVGSAISRPQHIARYLYPCP